MRRVLHVMYSLERSGMETMLLSSAGEWARHGLCCGVLATAATPGPLANAMRDAGYAVHHVPGRAAGRALSVRSWWRFFRLARGYDVLHIHVESLATVYALVGRLAGVRQVARSIHNTFLFTELLRWRKRISRGLCRVMGVRFGMVSDSVARCEQERFSNAGVRTLNWLDVEHFRPPIAQERAAARAELAFAEGLRLLTVGNCNAAKNHHALLRALPSLRRRMPVAYLHVGREPKETSERALAGELGLADLVRFEGSQADPRRYFWGCDLFVMPSVYEGLGVAALEAIACGCAAVLSDVPGLCEVLAAAPHAVACGTAAEAVATGVLELAGRSVAERGAGALLDSAAVREMFSARRGVDVMVRALYDDDGVRA